MRWAMTFVERTHGDRGRGAAVLLLIVALAMVFTVLLGAVFGFMPARRTAMPARQALSRALRERG